MAHTGGRGTIGECGADEPGISRFGPACRELDMRQALKSFLGLPRITVRRMMIYVALGALALQAMIALPPYIKMVRVHWGVCNRRAAGYSREAADCRRLGTLYPGETPIFELRCSRAEGRIHVLGPWRSRRPFNTRLSRRSTREPGGAPGPACRPSHQGRGQDPTKLARTGEGRCGKLERPNQRSGLSHVQIGSTGMAWPLTVLDTLAALLVAVAAVVSAWVGAGGMDLPGALAPPAWSEIWASTKALPPSPPADYAVISRLWPSFPCPKTVG